MEQPCPDLCGGTCVRKTVRNGPNRGRVCWDCASCSYFRFEGAAVAAVAKAGPPCRCPGRQLSVARTVTKEGSNKGRKFWTCAAANERARCDFFQWQDDQALRAAAVAPGGTTRCQSRRQRDGFATFLSDYTTMQTAQRMLKVSDGTQLGVGRDLTEPAPPYDSLKVMGVWRIKNDVTHARYAARRAQIGRDCERTGYRRAHVACEEAGAALGELHPGVNEVRLLHGTKPENLTSILFDGVRLPERQGLFGAGTYLAEDAAKSDQYCTRDESSKAHDRWADAHPALHELHRKIWSFEAKHPKDVHYMLICKVTLGRTEITRDGKTSCLAAGAQVFDGAERKRLRPGFHSLIAETGGRVQRFREFVLFEPDQVIVEYLVAFHRVQRHCLRCSNREVSTAESGAGTNSSYRLSERTVKKQTMNFGRTILCCDNCRNTTMLPVCHCSSVGTVAGISASASTSKRGYPRWSCGNTGRRRGTHSRCDFNVQRTVITPATVEDDHAASSAAAGQSTSPAKKRRLRGDFGSPVFSPATDGPSTRLSNGSSSASAEDEASIGDDALLAMPLDEIIAAANSARPKQTPVPMPASAPAVAANADNRSTGRLTVAHTAAYVGTQTPGLGPYTTNRDIPALGATG